jgi:hypothetical protein
MFYSSVDFCEQRRPRPLHFDAICYVLFVCYCWRAAAPAPAPFGGHYYTFFRLDPSWSHLQTCCFEPSNHHEKTAVPMDGS